MTARGLSAPFPWFGGKSRIAAEIWRRIGDVPNYIEPFAGSAAILLRRPHELGRQLETINDIDGMVSNFWRSIRSAPEETARHAEWPIVENDLHARHAWLVERRESLRSRLEGDPDWCDPKVAGWWVWGVSAWIGRGFCAGSGPWSVVDGELVRGEGRAIERRVPHLSTAGQGVTPRRDLGRTFAELSRRLARVRVLCGDWTRGVGSGSLRARGEAVGVVLDPPYAIRAGHTLAYAHDSLEVSADVRAWAIEQGRDESIRIALCGYDGEHDMPDDWRILEWTASAGYGAKNPGGPGDRLRSSERVWFSPGCLEPESDGRQLELFGANGGAFA